MDFALATVTVVSLTMTIAMAVVTWHLLREERRRSAARLAALTTDIERSRLAPSPSSAEPAPYRMPDTRATAPVRSAPSGSGKNRLLDLPIRPAAAGRARAVPADLFATPVESSGWTRLMSAMGGAALVVTVAVLGVVLLNRHSENAGAVPTAIQPLPVELLDLAHERTGDEISIRGTVRNPDASSRADGLSVVAMAFDGSGAQVAERYAPLHHASLSPGEASAFSVSIPARAVSRYRISFVTGDTTVPHVDRRAGPLARSEPTPDAPGGQP